MRKEVIKLSCGVVSLFYRNEDHIAGGRVKSLAEIVHLLKHPPCIEKVVVTRKMGWGTHFLVT